MKQPKHTEAIQVGVDLDGVLTKNPLRAARVGVSYIKHKILGVKRVSFFVPKNGWQRLIYVCGIVLPSLIPARGTEKLKTMAMKEKYRFYLVTGRYGFVKNFTLGWLKRCDLLGAFDKVFINERNEQSHEYKQRLIRQYRFDYFIEDNWDIVAKLAEEGGVKICWVVNILDRNRPFPDKFNNLQEALERIEKENENPD